LKVAGAAAPFIWATRIIARMRGAQGRRPLLACRAGTRIIARMRGAQGGVQREPDRAQNAGRFGARRLRGLPEDRSHESICMAFCRVQSETGQAPWDEATKLAG